MNNDELKKLGLRSLSKEMEKFDIDETDVNEGEQLIIKEVCRKEDLILYEHEDEDIGSSVSDEIINKLFPEFEMDPRKYYIIEKDGEWYYQ
jgi:hypothetical protein